MKSFTENDLPSHIRNQVLELSQLVIGIKLRLTFKVGVYSTVEILKREISIL